MTTVLRGALVVDGTGTPPVRADVAVAGDVIVATGDVGRPSESRRVVDLDGLVLAPGFIDPHTHYDAQVMWDADLTPSSWHGVTTVVLGNCGFGVAPTRPQDRARILRLLERVEGMTLSALEAGVRWGFETFPEYVEQLDATPSRINVAAMLGHTPLRYFVMGAEADERPADEAEVAAMARLVEEALDAGAIGLSTTRSPGAVGADGKPVPSRVAELSEVRALAGVLGRKQKGTMVAAQGPDLGPDQFSEIARAIGRPLSWCALMASSKDPAAVRRVVERVEELGDGAVFPQVACQPVVVELTLASPDPFMNIPGFAAARRLAPRERTAVYRDPVWRAKTYEELVEIRGRLLDSAVVCESGRHADLVGGPTLGTLAAAQGTSPLDVLVELSLAEDLATRFRFMLNNDDETLLAELLDNRRLMVGLSDAGAHVTQHCDASYATYLLGTWWREREVLDLETAIWRLTGQPAAAFGLSDRGRVAPGFRADLVAFDPATIGPGPTQRVWDQPGGTDRLVSRGRGIEHVWVNGVATREHGADREGVRPGRLLRG